MNLLCHDKDCNSYGKKLVWIPKDKKHVGEYLQPNGEYVKYSYRLVCPSEIMTQSDYNLKFVKFESKAQMEEEDGA